MLPAHGENLTDHMELGNGRQDLPQGHIRWAQHICTQVLGTQHSLVCTVLGWESHMSGLLLRGGSNGEVGHVVGVGLMGAEPGDRWAGRR